MSNKPSSPTISEREFGSTVTDSFRSRAEQWVVAWRPSAFAYSIALLTIAAAILRIAFLGSKSIWLDEGFTAARVTLPLKTLIGVIDHGQSNMGLYYVLVNGWTRIAGSSEFALRLPSALFDTATVPLIFWLGVELQERRAGLLGALFFAINANSVRYAQNARAYSLFMMLTVLSSIFFIRATKRATPSNLGAYVLSGTGAVYAHLFGIFAVPAQWLSLFLFRPGIRTVTRLTVCAFTIAMLSVPPFVVAIVYDHGSLDWVGKTTLRSVVTVLLMFAGALDGRLNAQTIVLFCLFLSGIVFALVRAPRVEWPKLGYLLLSFGVPILMTLAASFFKPVFVRRYLLAELPFFALLTAIGLIRLTPRILAISMTVMICVLGLSETNAYYHAAPRQDWRAEVKFVAANYKSNDVLLIYPGFCFQSINYYVSKLAPPAQFPLMFGLAKDAKGIENLERFLTGHGRRIWFTFASQSDHSDFARNNNALSVLEILTRDRQVVVHREFAGAQLYRLEAAPEFGSSSSH